MADKTPEQTPPPTAPPVKQPADKADEPITLNRAELQKLIDDNRREAEEATKGTLAQQAAKEKAEREEAEAVKRGEFEQLAAKEKSKREAAEAETKSLKTSIALRDHLTEKHPDYATCAKYILPLIPADAEGDALTKAIETAAADYVKDNPRTPKGNGPPAPPARGANRGILSNPVPQNNERPVRRFSTLTYRS